MLAVVVERNLKLSRASLYWHLCEPIVWRLNRPCSLLRVRKRKQKQQKKRRDRERENGSEKKVDLPEPSTSGNSSLVRKNLAFREKINWCGYSEGYEEPVTWDWIRCEKVLRVVGRRLHEIWRYVCVCARGLGSQGVQEYAFAFFI
jgi:hypothetical protein